MEIQNLSEVFDFDKWGDPVQLAIALVLSFILGLLISYVYRITHKGVTFSQSFAATIIILAVVTTFIIYFIGDSLANAIGLFGVFSIIRFRTATKDSRDTAFVLFSLGAGMAVGVGAVVMAYTGVAVISVLMYLVSRLNLTNAPKIDYIVHFRLDSKSAENNDVSALLRSMTKDASLLHVNSKKQGSVLDFSFNVTTKQGVEIGEIIEELNKIKGISDVSFVASKNDIAY